MVYCIRDAVSIAPCILYACNRFSDYMQIWANCKHRYRLHEYSWRPITTSGITPADRHSCCRMQPSRRSSLRRRVFSTNRPLCKSCQSSHSSHWCNNCSMHGYCTRTIRYIYWHGRKQELEQELTYGSRKSWIITTHIHIHKIHLRYIFNIKLVQQYTRKKKEKKKKTKKQQKKTHAHRNYNKTRVKTKLYIVSQSWLQRRPY